MRKFSISGEVVIIEHYRLDNVKVTEETIDDYCAVYGENKEEVISNLDAHVKNIINYLDSEFGMYDFAYFKGSEMETYELEIVEDINNDGK